MTRRPPTTSARGTTWELLDIALPMVVSQGSFALMVFCDRLFLSYLGPEHVAAAMAGGVASFFTTALFIGTLSYSNALAAQYYGRGDTWKCPRVVTQGWLMVLACWPVILLARMRRSGCTSYSASWDTWKLNWYWSVSTTRC